MEGLALLGIGLLIYFLPAIVAKQREHRQFGAIVILNLLLGWTIIGWVAAIVWAMTIERTPPAPAPLQSGRRTARLDELERLAELRERGVLTEDEFAAQKRRLLEDNDR